MPQPNCQYTTRYCWEADKVKTLIRLRAELSPLFTGKRNASKYAWAVVERELNVPLPLSKIIKKWNNLLQEYKAIKLSDEPKRREWPFFNLMDYYFSDQVNDPTLRLFSSTKTLGADTFDDGIKLEDDPIMSSALAAATAGNFMDISEMIAQRQQQQQQQQLDAQSDKVSDSTFEDLHSDAPLHVSHNNNNSTTNNNNNNNNNHHHHNNNNNSYKFMDRHREFDEKMECAVKQQQQPMPQHIPSYLHQQPQHSPQHQAAAAQQQASPPHAAQQPAKPAPQQQQLPPHQQQHNIDQYLLSWNNFHGNMCKGFHNLQKDEKMVDVTIAAGGKVFKAHKLVLSVCSPYFQKIFLEHPSTHPILFMTDVNSGHMAGLLDFMYSGQVNVKYEDLPKFLKVAEAMQIKGLHKESTSELEEMMKPKPQEPRKEPIIKTVSQINANISVGHMNNGNGLNNGNGHTGAGVHIPMMPQAAAAAISREPNFREHIIRAKIPAHLDMFNNNNNNNNNNNSIMTNNNHINHNNNNIAMANNNNNNPSMLNNNHSPSKYVIHQTNTSNKILDNQKYHKYFSKRKMMAQYENEMQSADKRNRMSVSSSSIIGVTEDLSLKSSRRSNSPSSVSGCSDNNCGSTANGNGINGAVSGSVTPGVLDMNVSSQSIKVEPDIVMANDDEEDDESIEDGAPHSIGHASSHHNRNSVSSNHNDDGDSPHDLTATATAHADFYHNLADLTTKRSQHSHVVEHMAALAHIRADAESRSMSAAAICS